MEDTTETNYSHLDEEVASLESLHFDMQCAARERDHSPQRRAGQRHMLRSLGYGMEAAGGLKSHLQAVEAAEKVERSRFEKVLDFFKGAFDKVGAIELKRVRELLHNTHGEGAGVFTHAKLANQLQMHGVVPTTFTEVNHEMLKAVQELSTRYAPEVAKVAQAARPTIASAFPRTAEEFHDVLLRLAHIAIGSPAPDSLIAPFEHMVFPGGRRLVRKAFMAHDIRPHSKVQDAPSKEIYRRIENCELTIDRHGAKPSATGASQFQLKVLSRVEIAQLLEMCEHLVVGATNLLEMSKQRASNLDGRGVAHLIDVTIQWMQGGGIEVDDETREVLNDYRVQVDSDDWARADWLSTYYALPHLQARRTLELMFKIVTSVTEAYLRYARESLKRFK